MNVALKRRFALAVLFFFIATLLLSFDFLPANVEHDCCGSDCSVCAVLQLTDEFSGGKKALAVAAFTLSLAVCAATLFLSGSVKFIAAENPVSLKNLLTI